jgi:hypothetical protein
MDIHNLMKMMILSSFNSMKKIMMDMTMIKLKKKKTILIKKILN